MRIEIEECGHSAMEADPRIVRQVLSNIVGNAVKYSAGGGFVRLSVRRPDDGGPGGVIRPGLHPRAVYFFKPASEDLPYYRCEASWWKNIFHAQRGAEKKVTA